MNVDQNLEELTTAHLADACVQQGVVVADDDGAIFLPENKLGEIAVAAGTIRERERQQAELLASGTPLFQQLHFVEYLDKSANDPSYTLRLHLQAIARAIET